MEQDPDRWCSHTPDGQEFWQILSQWVWNTRLELGLVQQDYALRRTCWSAALPAVAQAEAGAPAGRPEAAAHGGQALRVSYGPPEVARARGRAGGRLAGQAFTVLADGTLRCPAGKTLRPQERRPEADGTLRIVYRARQEDCRACTYAAACLGPHAAGAQPRRVSAVCRRIAEPGGVHAAQLHEDVPADRSHGPAEVVWSDLPAYRIRRDYITWARRQQVSIVSLPAAPPAAIAAGTPRLWTRAERAHRRLSWAARLARNAWAADSVRYVCTVFGVAPALATFLGLPPDPS